MNDYIKKFKIPFYQFKINNWDQKKEKILELYSKVEKNIIVNDNISNVYSDFFSEVNYTEIIKQIFYDDLQKFLKKSHHSNCSITEAWFQSYIKGCFHSPHNHGPLGFSSVCYIKYDENEHQPTRFICPFSGYDGKIVEYTPENITEGVIIFFPSMLMHYVLPTSSEKERIILSMNIEIHS